MLTMPAMQLMGDAAMLAMQRCSDAAVAAMQRAAICDARYVRRDAS
jgi:hypothetical protein